MAPQGTPPWLVNGLVTLNSTDAEVKEYMGRLINPSSPRRRWHTQRAAMHLWFYLGRHWIEPVGQLAPGNGTYHFKEVERQSEASFPRPVTNLCSQAIDNEVARLTRKELVPDSAASKSDPEWIAAAKLAKDIVRWEMTKQMWDSKREDCAFSLCLDGMMALRTWWDENDAELSLISTPDPRECPTCARKYASARVPENFASLGMPGEDGPVPMFHSETLKEAQLMKGEATAMFPEGIKLAQMTNCPYCEQPSALRPYKVGPEQAAKEVDPFGRQMGLFVPRGDGLLDVVTVHDLYFENGGIGLEPHQQRCQGLMMPRPLEWLAIRLPEIAEKLTAEAPTELLKLHPLYADTAFERGLDSRGVGQETYQNHARLKELTIQPQPGIPGLEKGAWFLQVGENLVRRDLCVLIETESEKKLPSEQMVPKVRYHYARFKRIPKMCYGWTFMTDLIPINRRLNELDAQIVDLRERGVPNMWVPAGVEVYQTPDAQGSMRLIEYDGAPSNWEPRNSIFPGTAITGQDYFQERRSILDDARGVGMPQDIEIGNSPGSVKTTSGLMLLAEEASQKRGPRERALASAFEGAFDHILQLNAAFRQEEAIYEVMDESGTFEIKSFTGPDLLPNVRVRMKAAPGFDQALYDKEAAAEGMDRGLIVNDSPAARDRILEVMRLPKNINEGTTLQIQRAEMAWADFKRDFRIPVIDPTIFDAPTWWSVLGKRWFDDDCHAMQETARWEDILPRIFGWESKMAEMEALEATQKPVYGNLDPSMWQGAFDQGSALVAAANEKYQAAQQQFMQLPPEMQAGQMPPPAPAMQQFPAPPTEEWLPEQLELKIYAVWRRLAPELKMGVEAAEKREDDSEGLLLLDSLLKMRAVIEAFRLMATGQRTTGGQIPAPMMLGPEMGAPGMAAPPGAPPAPPAGGPAGPAPAGSAPPGSA
jgi:hypothetical protein